MGEASASAFAAKTEGIGGNMSKRKPFDPAAYTLESQLRDMVNGYDVAADDTSVIKVRQDGSGVAFVKSDGPRGHDRYDRDQNGWRRTH